MRAHLLSLERDGLVHQSGTQPGFRKPHATYALTAEAEQIFPKSYGVLLDLILIVISRQLSPKELRAAMREVGKRVADNHLLEVKGKSRNKRIEAALRILKDLGGSATFEKSEGKHFIRGHGCPLAAATSRHPEACLIAETLLSEIIGAPVKECCIHGALHHVASRSVDRSVLLQVNRFLHSARLTRFAAIAASRGSSGRFFISRRGSFRSLG